MKKWEELQAAYTLWKILTCTREQWRHDPHFAMWLVKKTRALLSTNQIQN